MYTSMPLFTGNGSWKVHEVGEVAGFVYDTVTVDDGVFSIVNFNGHESIFEFPKSFQFDALPPAAMAYCLPGDVLFCMVVFMSPVGRTELVQFGYILFDDSLFMAMLRYFVPPTLNITMMLVFSCIYKSVLLIVMLIMDV